jgi:quercetin dioxygenase-like cupin family protein
VSPHFHVQRAAERELAAPADAADHAGGWRTAALVGPHVESVHTGFALCSLEPGGHVDAHLHSTEQSFYVLAGNPHLTVDCRTYRLAAHEVGLVPVGVPHGWQNESDGEARWIEVNSPAPRLSGPADTFWTGDPAPGGHTAAGGDTAAGDDLAPPVDIRDPRTRTFFRLGAGEMDVDNLKIGAAVDSPTVSASMATALLAYSGIAVKMLVDARLGAVLHQMFMVEYQPGGVAQPHDHPFEETYYVLEGDVEATADGNEFTLGAGDLFWTGVGSIHAFYNRSPGRVRFLETQSPQPPANYSYRFNRDWDYLAERLGGGRRG